MSYDFRPKKFSDIVGNEINNKILLTIAKNGGPSTMIFAGDFGCGKTTSARIFAKACNCENLVNDICCECESCKMTYDNCPYYTEYDSSLFNKVDDIRDLYEELTFVPKGKTRIITMDEFHLLSRQAMSALLKVFEDAPANIYYLLCTTDKDAILPTIISRSLVLNFNTKPKNEVVENLYKIANIHNINISDNVANLIALRSKGHMRDAHKLFEKYLLVGEKDFLNLEESGYNYLAKYFAQTLWLVKNTKAPIDEIKKHKTIMLEIVDRLMRIPIALLKDDYQNLFLDLIKKLVNPEYEVEPIIEALIRSTDSRSIMNLYKIATEDFVMNSFDNDIRFQTALLSIYQRLSLGI